MRDIHLQYLVDESGQPRSVLLPIEEFEELVECAEDVLDAAEIERLKSEPRFSWSQVKGEHETGRKE